MTNLRHEMMDDDGSKTVFEFDGEMFRIGRYWHHNNAPDEWFSYQDEGWSASVDDGRIDELAKFMDQIKRSRLPASYSGGTETEDTCWGCPKRLGVPGAWSCVLRRGHRGPHRGEAGEVTTKIWIGPYDHYIEDPDLLPEETPEPETA